jgi:hypothetical protein
VHSFALGGWLLNSGPAVGRLGKGGVVGMPASVMDACGLTQLSSIVIES